MVVTWRPCTRAASVRQDTTRSPSTCTVQAPQEPWLQPFLVPVIPAYSRRASSSEVRGSIVSGTALPFTVSTTSSDGSAVTGTAAGTGGGATAGAATAGNGSTASPAPVPSSPRRVSLGSCIGASFRLGRRRPAPAAHRGTVRVGAALRHSRVLVRSPILFVT